ncbi:MAG: integrase family protein [Actinomycetia bacterium]|nr:integrase family protein [Actinomycetes bacterium]
MSAAQVYALDPLKDSRHREAVAARDLSDWLKWLEVGNKAARTLDTYERTCAVLLRAFPNTAFADFTDGDLMHVLALFPARSRHINKAALNSWFKWGYTTRRIPGNPVALLPAIPYRANRSYDLFTEAESDALCALPSPDGHLLTLMFWGGLRRAEARYLTGKRLDLGQRQIIITEGAKGSKTRRVPMIGRVSIAAAELLTLEGIGHDDHLWGSRPGGGRVRRHRPIGNTTFDQWWVKALAAADVRHRKPHMTRHSFATRLRELGMAMEEIQALLGHESIRTTSDTYVHSNLSAIGAHLREVVGDLA